MHNEKQNDLIDNTDENSELFEHHRIEVDKGQGVLRIDKFLVDKLEAVSRSKIQAASAAGSILVNSLPVKANYKVKPGDVVSIVLPHPPRELEIIPEDLPVAIVYEDNDLVVVNKAPGMVVHPGHGNYTGTLVNALAFLLKDAPLFNKDELRPGLVHRIDKDTSGLLVVAKTEVALNHLARQFYEKSTYRRYTALVWGNLDEEEGTINGNIGRHLTDRMQMAVFPHGDHGKHAVTHYKVLERLGYVNLVECRLETGRTHQIRVHMKYLGHPVFNDVRYGGDEILRGTTFNKYKQFVQNCFNILPRQGLHARALGFTHPVSGKQMMFESELPTDMTDVIEKWRNYTASRNGEE